MGAVVLVSVKEYDLPNIQTLKSIKGVDWSEVDCLLFHSTVDKDLDIILELTALKGRVGKVIYISETINPLYYCIFTGMEADIYNSESYLDDGESLQFLIDSYKETGITLKSPDSDVDTLAKAIALLSSSNLESVQKMLSNSYWLKTLNTAVVNVDNAIARAYSINLNIVDMLAETRELIRSLSDSHETTSREIEKLKNLIVEMDKKTPSNVPHTYPAYSVPIGAKKVLYIKAVGHCRYLNSFLLVYRHYLKMTKQYNSKLIFLLPKMKSYMTRFRDFTRLATENGSFNSELVNSEGSYEFVTYEPTRAVLDAFFQLNKVDLFIVIDLMMGDDSIKDQHNVEKLYAVSSVSDIARFKLKTDRTINCIVKAEGVITIKHIAGYASATESSRRAKYSQECAEAFQALDRVVFKEGL